jgi:hypothetical protein
MSIKFDLKEIERRTNYAVLQDGLLELALGLFLFLYGGILGTKAIPLGVLLIVFAVFLAKPLLENIKNRYIYPRLGYVRLPDVTQATGKGIALTVIALVVILFAALGISLAVLGVEAGRDFFLRYILPPVSGVALAIGPFWMGQTYGLRRGYLWAALFILGGCALPLSGLASGYQAVGLLCTLMGLLIGLTSAFMFGRFLRKYPPAVEEAPHAS